MEALILELHKIEAVKFGSFKLKPGIISPIYIDLHLIISYPTLLSRIADLLFSAISCAAFDLVCGIPYTALPITAILSVSHAVPMVMHRKEIKDHGTGRTIEGTFCPGQVCLVIEDIVTSGASILKITAPLHAEALEVCDVIVIIDREQDGCENLVAQGICLHALTTLSDVLRVLVAHGRVSEEKAT